MLPLLLLAFAGPPLQAPWSCGESFLVSQGNNGSLSHQGVEAYAWDFDLDEGDPILAAAGGTVIQLRKDSTVGGCSSAYGNDANYVVIDHGDGTSGLYLHLAPFSSPLSLGDTVQTGDFIGRVGLTGWVCGDHLHFQVQQVCGSWYCQSVPAEFADYGVPGYLDALDSNNCPGCGAVLDGGTTTIESSDLACFDGLIPAWADSSQGEGGHSFHALATNATTSTGRWNFGVSLPGDYEVLVNVPAADASATGATYVVHHADGSDAVTLDQGTDKGWQSLGVYPFTGGDPRIELADGTGDDPGAGLRVSFDAVRLIHVPSAGDDTGPGGSEGGEDESGGAATGGPGPGGGDDPDPDGSGDGLGTGGGGGGDPDGGGTDGNALPGWEPDSSDGGCTCRGGATTPSGAPWALSLVLLLGWRRRSTSVRSRHQ